MVRDEVYFVAILLQLYHNCYHLITGGSRWRTVQFRRVIPVLRLRREIPELSASY